MCTFTWAGCASTALSIPSPGSYPMIGLSEITEDLIDAYYYLGPDKIGCMDKLASNYLVSAVLHDESCIYLSGDVGLQAEIKIYPQPATTHATIEFVGNENINNKEFVIHNTIGEKIYVGLASTEMSIEVDTYNWMAGVYYVLIKMENRNLTHRFVVE